MNRYSTDDDPFVDLNRYDALEEETASRYVSREARRKRKVKVRHEAKVSEEAILAATAETVGLEGGFNPTYTPSRHEAGWIEAALQEFYNKELIVDVLYQVKGGKEANVYCCRAHPSTGVDFLAAKIYRPRRLRNLRNDKQYRQGRTVIGLDGKELRKERELRALNKKSEFGAQLQHQSWMRYEFDTLQTLHAAGAPVPQPWLISHNAILMGFVGGEHAAAPVLQAVQLGADSAESLFDKTLATIDLMLRCDVVHGDLSPFNILYWNDDITIIDFPQAINPYRNPDVYAILRRDVTRVCDYFRRQGVQRARSARVFHALWQRHLEPDAAERAGFRADDSRLLADDDEP